MVSAAINGNLGDWVANQTRYVYTENKQRLLFEGTITLYFNDVPISSRQFASRYHRSDIIKKWITFYQLQNKTNIYFQISYL